MQIDPCCGMAPAIMPNLLERTASSKTPLGHAVGQAPLLVRVGVLILVASPFSWEEDGIVDKKLWLGSGFSADKDGASISSAKCLREFLEQPGSTEGAAYELVEGFDTRWPSPSGGRVILGKHPVIHRYC